MVDSVSDCLELQLDIDKFTQWSDKWQLKLNTTKTNKVTIRADKLNYRYN